MEQEIKSLVKIKEIRSFSNVDEFAFNFKKELKKINVDAVIHEPDVNLAYLADAIRQMRPNTLVFNNANTFVVVTTDIIVKGYIAMRKNRLLTTGTYAECALAILMQMQKEYPAQTANFEVSMIDDMFLSKFSAVHYDNTNYFKIIKT